MPVQTSTVVSVARVADSLRGLTQHKAPGERRLAGRVAHVAIRTPIELFRYRVTGLAAEAAFFALLSLPPLILGLIGTLGYARSLVGPGTIGNIRVFVLDNAATILTQPTVDSIVEPLLADVLSGGRADVVSVSFVIALWSGSRALNVYVDTITIAYGFAGYRHVVITRTLSFALYLVGLGIGIFVLPLIVAGPTLARQALPGSGHWVDILYWPVVVALSMIFLALLYHVAVPIRSSWWRALPGAMLAVLVWIAGSFLLRLYLQNSFGGLSLYRSLSAPIAVLGWLFITALAVLIGAALNAEIDKEWPSAATQRARQREQPSSPEDNQLEPRKPF